MKTKLLFGAMLLVGVSAASAQQSVVKDAERAAKGGKPVAEVVKMITPAFTNPETANDPKTWFVPGEAAINEYDNLFAKKQFGKLPQNGDMLMAEDVLLAYDYLNKVFPLDSVPNAKGKVDPKYSKKVINLLGGHYNDLKDAGFVFHKAEKYDKAVEAWDAYVSLSLDPRYAKALTPANDTIVGEIMFNQALCSHFAEQDANAVKYFRNARDKGYNKKMLYDYAITVASKIEDHEAVFEFAQEALPLYGNEDPNYIAQMIMYYINDKKYDEAIALVDKAIVENPGNAQYLVIKGVLLEQLDKPKADITKCYKDAVDVDPENAQAQYGYGRMLCEEAYEIDSNAPVKEAEYKKVFEGEILPRFNIAVKHLEKARELDPDNTNVLYYLQNVYYNLHDAEKENEIKALLGM